MDESLLSPAGTGSVAQLSEVRHSIYLLDAELPLTRLLCLIKILHRITL